MGRTVVVLAVAMLAAAGSYAGATDRCLVNASFEDDGWVKELGTRDPNGWDVNLPAGGFRGYVYSDWATEGMYSLTLFADWFATFTAGETATVSQQIMLDGVVHITFDLKLQTVGYSPWDPSVCCPVVLIDDAAVWEPNLAQVDLRGEYRDIECDVGSAYWDGQPHRLSLGLRVGATGMLFEKYVSQWDSVTCALACGGRILPGDFNSDCCVDMADLTTMMAMWLASVPSADRFNLSGIDDVESAGLVNFYDLAVFGDMWRTCSPVEQETTGP